MKIRRIILAIFILYCQAVFLTSIYCADRDPDLKRSYLTFGEVELPALSSASESDYLGVMPGRAVKLSEIKGEVLILEVFNVYCYHCQRQAPDMNRLYRLIEKQGLLDRIKMIGIVMSNSQMEADIFKKKYNSLFPVFPDPDNSLYRLVGRGQTPYVNILKNDGHGNIEKIYAVERNLPEPENFLNGIIEASGIVK